MSNLPPYSKNRSRITSDSYDITLIFKNHNNLTLNLTDHFGITNFEWESRDEIIVKKPITRLEPIAIVSQNGIDITFESKKENLGDLLDLLISQQNLYYGSGTDGRKIVASLGANKRTDTSNQSLIKEGTSIFSGQGRYYATPKYDLLVKIRHHSLDSSNTSVFEQMIFKDVTFYKPYQKVSENSPSIIEGFKAFASRLVKDENSTKKGSTFDEIVEKSLNSEFERRSEPEKYHRIIINPDNKDLVE